MQPSSDRYSSEITPEPGLRGVVLGSGLVFALLGAGVLATLPGPLAVRALAAVLWLCGSLASVRRLLLTYRGIAGFRLYSDGSAELIRPDGRRIIGQLAPGTFVLRRLAWLRVSVPGRGPVGELVAGDPRTSQQWRRFQVICRHVAAC